MGRRLWSYLGTPRQHHWRAHLPLLHPQAEFSLLWCPYPTRKENDFFSFGCLRFPRNPAAQLPRPCSPRVLHSFAKNSFFVSPLSDLNLSLSSLPQNLPSLFSPKEGKAFPPFISLQCFHSLHQSTNKWWRVHQLATTPTQCAELRNPVHSLTAHVPRLSSPRCKPRDVTRTSFLFGSNLHAIFV